MKNFVYAFTFSVLAAQALAVPEVALIRLGTTFSYKDSSVSCPEFGALGEVYFSAQIEGRKVLGARLFRYQGSQNGIDLTSNEVNSIELYLDPELGIWIDRWSPSDKSLAFLLYRSMSYLCYPEKMIETIEPENWRFDFSLSTVKEGIPVSFSQTLLFQGLLRDKSPFKASLRLKQILMNDMDGGQK